jgi:hypothetical protein
MKDERQIANGLCSSFIIHPSEIALTCSNSYLTMKAMAAFVNTLSGADADDVNGWALHIRDQFPERTDAIDAALHLPISPGMRDQAVRIVVERAIASLIEPLTEIPRSRRETLLDVADDPLKKAEQKLANIGAPVLAREAAQKGISVEQLKRQLLERLARGESTR